MSDPRRLLEGASGLERELLEVGLSADPPSGAEQDVWRGLSEALPGGFDPSDGPDGGGEGGGEGFGDIDTGGGELGAAGDGSASDLGGSVDLGGGEIDAGLDWTGVDVSGIAQAGGGVGASAGVGAGAAGVASPGVVLTAAGGASTAIGPAVGGGVVAGGGGLLGALKAVAIGVVSAGLLAGANEIVLEPSATTTVSEASRAPSAPAPVVTGVADARGWVGGPTVGGEGVPAVREEEAEAAAGEETADEGTTSAKQVAPTGEPADPSVDSTTESAAAPTQESSLREESAALASARALLRSGDPLGALAALDAAARRFPGGSLAQERAALTIEALAASGRNAQAAEHARAFLNAYPGSAHAARVRQFL